MASAAALSIVINAEDKAGKVLGGLQKQVQGFGKTLLNNSKAIGVGMTAAGAGILAAGLMSVKTFAEMGDEVQKMALKTGFSTERLSELRFAAEQSGASIESIDKAVKRMSKSLIDADRGLETYQRSFDALGLSTEEVLKLSPEEQFNTISMALAEVEDQALKSALAQEIFGRAGTELLPLLAQGADGIAELAAEAKELGIVFDQEAANSAAKLTDDMNSMQRSMDGVKVNIAQALIPVLIPLIKKITSVIKSITEWLKANPILSKVIIVVVGAIGALLAVLGPLMIFLPGIIAALPLLGVAFAAITGPIGLIVAAIAGAIAIGVLIVKNWDTIKEKAAQIWGSIKDFFVGIWDKIKDVFKDHWDKILLILFPAAGIIALFAKNWDKVADFFKDIWDKVKSATVSAFDSIKETIMGAFRTAVNFVIDQLNKLIRLINRIPGVSIGELGRIEAPMGPVLPGFQRGGIVPGPVGRPMAAIVHGGERIMPANQAGAGVTVVMQGPMFLGDATDARKLADLIGEELQRKVRSGFNLVTD
tara:strand:+ start:16998 stop:18602 length:1605 start_codon:yes stop_codon:yes gene_type:complete